MVTAARNPGRPNRVISSITTSIILIIVPQEKIDNNLFWGLDNFGNFSIIRVGWFDTDISLREGQRVSKISHVTS